MASELPLQVRVLIGLEGDRSIIIDSELFKGRGGLIFGSGADEIIDSGEIYVKCHDAAYFDNGKPVREIVYRVEREK